MLPAFNGRSGVLGRTAWPGIGCPGGTGILLHPTSLWGNWGIGTLGEELHSFLDWASDAGFNWWQILPLSPTGFGNSPYQPLSSFAGNPLLISPSTLHRQGLLTQKELAAESSPSSPRVEWEALLPRRLGLMARASERALKLDPPGFDAFLTRNGEWLDPWADYAALKEANGGVSWREWKTLTVPREKAMVHRMVQFLFQEQWDAVLRRCLDSGIRVLGDLPIYTAHDSADVWSQPGLFMLTGSGDPAAVAGVPPDYFSRTGQLWGNPLYDWAAHREQGYRWWALRLSRAMDLCHSVRIDHFRGFCDYWEIPAGSQTAENGAWRKGPGKRLFKRVSRDLGDRLSIVAEDLGLITGDVAALREELGYPGMLVLQFALADPGFDPASIPSNTVLYTGTHDNDTTAGWLRTSDLRMELEDVTGIALRSPANLCVFPVQDILGLGSGSRMNTPGTRDGNWSFRLTPGSLDTAAAARWRNLTACRRGT